MCTIAATGLNMLTARAHGVDELIDKQMLCLTPWGGQMYASWG